MADIQKLILIAIGPDQVGLVQKISQFIKDRGGNIEDSRMVVMVGEFALMLLVSGAPANLRQIAESTSELSAQTGLQVSTKSPTARKVSEPAIPYRLVASCMDHPGVVHKLSSAVSAHGANIESMETQTYAAPITGAPIFQMEAVITIPARVNVGALRDALEAMERDQNINIDFELITHSNE
jgi:glycine cleavage system transcriptional repressor